MELVRIFDGKGWTTDQYDALIARMDLRGHAAPGVLFHWAAATDDGIRVVDVYSSRDAADRLAQEQVGPAVGALGLSMPTITEFEVHSVLTPEGAAVR